MCFVCVFVCVLSPFNVTVSKEKFDFCACVCFLS